MDQSLLILCKALRKILWQLKPQHNALSFLLLTGHARQGMTTLLRQSNLLHVAVESERNVDIYYNANGVVIELDEAWLNNSHSLLQNTLKQLNRCHRAAKISGIIYCIDVNQLFTNDPVQFSEQVKAHKALLSRFGSNLGYRVDLALLFTKLDSLVGFCEFFHNEHASELKKPLGFSLFSNIQKEKIIPHYRQQFDQLVEMLEQKVISKMHPVRSSLKRTLIRELPLQLASLRTMIQALVQNVPYQFFRLNAIYLTSAAQGGISEDRLNKKIKHEYALVVQDQFHQSVNHRAYFVEGAFAAFQKQTRHPIPSYSSRHKGIIAGCVTAFAITLAYLGYNYIHSSHLLDEVSKELLAYEALTGQQNKKAPAAYHLNQASITLNAIASNSLSLPTIEHLKYKLRFNTNQHLQSNFLPSILTELEQSMTSAHESHAKRYQALKIYLMLSLPERYSQTEVENWFLSRWNNESKEDLGKKVALLRQVLRKPLQPLPVNLQLIRDIRNYLNALPDNYLYYSLAKDRFPSDQTAINLESFQLASRYIPAYFTKAGFKEVMHMLPQVSEHLQQENWVLNRPLVKELANTLQQAYTYEYTAWWKNFIKQTRLQRFKEYQQAHQTLHSLLNSNELNQLITLIQENTTPEFNEQGNLFNQEIASHFTHINLISQSIIQELNNNLIELEKLLNTLAVIRDEGKTAFSLTRARFMGDTMANPLSSLFNRSQQLPEPLSTWCMQLLDDSWFLLINSSKMYINQQWQQTVFNQYKEQIVNRYPFAPTEKKEIQIAAFDRFFATHGLLNQFINYYIKPFLDTTQAQWQPKELNSYALPFSEETLNGLIRANIITNMFYPEQSEQCRIEFSLQKISLDPIIASLQLTLGENQIKDDQVSESFGRFFWPHANAKLSLASIDGHYYELEESGPWAFFRMLQKVNVLTDPQDSSMLQILFEVNGNSGRYLLRTHHQINPFIPGLLNDFKLPEAIIG